MTRPRLLDLYCGAGGAGAGYAAAGFDVVGVDLEPQPHYPFAFIRGDVLALEPGFVRFFDAVHASPPCQFGTALRHAPGAREHLNLIPATRALLEAAGRPFVIENVESDELRRHLRNPVRLCGSSFGLGARGFHLRRHRLFECSFSIEAPPCAHRSPVVGVYGGHVRNRAARAGGRGTADFVDVADRLAFACEALGVDWPITLNEASQAIPPAFTRFVGERLAAHLAGETVDG